MNILLLQGPIGPFFHALSQVLQADGHQVFRIWFNGGDEYWPGVGHGEPFQGKPEEWNSFIRRYIKQHRIEMVACYGDCRYYHKLAARICRLRHIPFWAMEEGYLRPDFITVERGGVNAFSPWYAKRHLLPDMQWTTSFDASLSIGPTMALRSKFAMLYYLHKAWGRWKYRHYKHHRPWNFFEELSGWVSGAVVKQWYRVADVQLRKTIQAHKGHVFFVPLQVTEDFQIREHSPLSGVEEMVAEVINSFAAHAKSRDVLLFKHHPMDRGFVHYRSQIQRLINLLGLEGRVFYGYELPLPELYPLLKGVVTINSTVGLSALLHSVPTFCLGRAIYDLPGLTTQGELAQFWRKPSPVDCEVFKRYRQSLLQLTQLNGSFYSQLEVSTAAVKEKILAKC